MNNQKSLGVYIHIPFCLKKCYYCDFCSFPDSDGERVERYTKELCRRIERSEELRGAKIDTLYFGGGTPTLLPIEQFSVIIDSVGKSAALDENAEVTAECNPATADLEYLRGLRAIGVNRLSMGLQSVHENELKALGRAHSFEDFKTTYGWAREVGFANISADLMYGIPEQTIDSFEKSIYTLAGLAPEHISSYGLKVERGTAFHKMGDKLLLPHEDEECKMYLSMCRILPSLGYEKYEISNFAKKGYESRHNLKYWNCQEYIGFGVAAHSCVGGERFGNSRDMDGFLRGENIECERYTLGERDRLNEYIMLSMRLREGLEISELEKRLSSSLSDILPNADQLVKMGYLQMCDGRVAFTDRGALVSNSILSDMLSFD